MPNPTEITVLWVRWETLSRPTCSCKFFFDVCVHLSTRCITSFQKEETACMFDMNFGYSNSL